jgi:uncharacterized membrane protein
VTYDHVIADVVQVVEAAGGAIMIVGGSWALVEYARSLLGLEVLIVGDIIRTIIVDPTVESVAVLGIIVLIRIVLSFSLEVEIDGAWPWNAWRLGPQEDPDAPGGGPTGAP